jgi:4-amino-4-deoxy-L-arabinose transferase-like glycosyltransferase
LRVAALVSLLVLACAGAWNHELWVYDEPREAELARAMWRSGNWTYTVLDEQPFLEKPPLFTASVAGAFALAGHPSVLVARLVAVAWSFLTLGLVAWFARRAIAPDAAWVAALVMATTNRFFTCQHTILLDNALCAFTTGALVFGWSALTEKRRVFAFLAGLCLAGAFLTKGLVGVGIAGLVLGIAACWVAYLGEGLGGAIALLPALPVALAPVLLYAWQLDRKDPGFVHELFWNNQFGRFFSGYNSVRTSWHLYLRTWHEMIGIWTPVALYALLPRPAARVKRLLLIWAFVPLVVLTLSQARARFYAVPVTPAYALLVTLVWSELALSDRARGVLGWLWFAGGAGVLGTAVAFFGLAPGDPVPILAAALAAGSLAGLLLLRRDPGAARETVALAFLPLVVAAHVLLWSDFVVRREEPHKSYKDVSDEVWKRAGDRKLFLYHIDDSKSGTFAFYADRSTPGFEKSQDPRGEKLIAAVGSNDLVLAPGGEIDSIPEEKRRVFSVEWETPRGDEKKDFVLYRRRESPP